MKRYSTYLVLLFCIYGFSQSKNEKEERIPAAEFPKVSHKYFNGIADKVNYLKFYRETDGNAQSFEAKFKLNKLHYNIEFNTDGVLEAIEIVIKEKNIPKDVLNNINAYLIKYFDKTRFIKIQKIYINTTKKNDQRFIQHVIENPEANNTHYSIIAETKNKGSRDLKELTFTSLGKFKKSRNVSSSSYEHVLY